GLRQTEVCRTRSRPLALRAIKELNKHARRELLRAVAAAQPMMNRIAHRLELADLVVNSLEPGFCNGPHLRDRVGAVLAHIEQRLYLGKSESQALRLLYESNRHHRLVGVFAVT